MYPGSVGLLQKAMRPMLQQGQAKLIEEVKRSSILAHIYLLNKSLVKLNPASFTLSQFNGQRNKLVACDGNEIDTMFVDRRKDGVPIGQTLVNAGGDLLFFLPRARSGGPT